MKTEEKAIQDVIDICHDGAAGYEKAASDVNNKEFKTIFGRLAQQRKLFIEELKNDVRDQGLELKDTGTVKGYFHRTWLDVKSSFSKKEDKQIIEEAKFGEKKAIEVYDDALHGEIPEYLRERLQKQKHLISGAINQLNEFESQAV